MLPRLQTSLSSSEVTSVQALRRVSFYKETMTDKSRFRNTFGENIFRFKYAQGPADTWDKLAERLVDDVCGTRGGTTTALMSLDECKQLTEYIKEMKFLPGGRYLYYAGRPFKAYNNCFLLRAEEDTREEWSNVTWRAMSCLMTGGGIGIDYSRLRPAGKALSRTGGTASGPLPLMYAINEIGRNVMQGGSRRSAIYASLNWRHEDIDKFLHVKDWSDDVKAAKEKDFNATAKSGSIPVVVPARMPIEPVGAIARYALG